MINIGKYSNQNEQSDNSSKKESQQEKIRLEANKIIKSIDGVEKSASEWLPVLEDGGNLQVRCPLAPEKHKNRDVNPSCSMSKKGLFLNFHCFACGCKGYYHHQPIESIEAVVLPAINKEEILSEIGSLPSSLLDVS